MSPSCFTNHQTGWGGGARENRPVFGGHRAPPALWRLGENVTGQDNHAPSVRAKREISLRFAQPINSREVLEMAGLFTPFRSREIELKKRTVVSPMCEYSAVDGHPHPWHLAHLGSRAVRRREAGVHRSHSRGSARQPEGSCRTLSTPTCALWFPAPVFSFQSVTNGLKLAAYRLPLCFQSLPTGKFLNPLVLQILHGCPRTGGAPTRDHLKNNLKPRHSFPCAFRVSLCTSFSQVTESLC